MLKVDGKIENIHVFPEVMHWRSTSESDYCCIRFPKEKQAAVTNKVCSVVSATCRPLARSKPVVR